MFSKNKIYKSIENYSDNIKKLKEEIKNADAIVIGAGAGLQRQQVIHITETVLINTSLILKRSTEYKICIAEDSIHTPIWKLLGILGEKYICESL